MITTVDAVNKAALERGVRKDIKQFQGLASHDQYRSCYREIQHWLSEKAGKKNCLDWGCGNGHLSFFLRQLDHRVTGYSFDGSPLAMDGAAGFTFRAGIQGDPIGLPFEDGSFDAVFSMGVLEHVHQYGGRDSGSLAELRRVLSPGGLFMCFHLPNTGTWIEAAAKAVSKGAHIHDRTYTRAMIKELWAEAGFNILSMRRYGFLPRNQMQRVSRLTDGRATRSLINAVDDLGAAAFAPICQNWSVIARRS